MDGKIMNKVLTDTLLFRRTEELEKNTTPNYLKLGNISSVTQALLLERMNEEGLSAIS